MSFGEFIPTPNTKLLLHLNGNANDDSGNGLNCGSTGVDYSRAYGKFNEGALFIASERDFIESTNHGLGSGNINFSASLRFYVTGGQVRGELFCLGNYRVTNQAIMFGVRTKSGGNNAVYFDYAVSAGGSTSARVLYNSWNHLFITKSGNTIIITLNGGVPETFTKTGLNASASFFMGFYGNIGAAHFSGYIDEFFLENRIWTPVEIQKYYTNSLGRF